MRNVNPQRQDARHSLRQTILASTLTLTASLAITSTSAAATAGFFDIQNPLRVSPTQIDAVAQPSPTPAPVETTSQDEAPRRMLQLSIASDETKSAVVPSPDADSQPLRSSTRSMLAIDAIGMQDASSASELSAISTTPTIEPFSLVASSSVATSQDQSTKTQPITGHFVLGEHGWLFIPADGQVTLLYTQTVQSDIKPHNGFRDAVAVDKLRSATQNFVELFPPNRLRDLQAERTAAAKVNVARGTQADAELFFRQPASPQQQQVAKTISLDAAIVADDLMLQRVLQTVRKQELMRFTANDTTDNTSPWQVTGTITNVDGQTLLTLHTAQPIRR